MTTDSALPISAALAAIGCEATAAAGATAASRHIPRGSGRGEPVCRSCPWEVYGTARLTGGRGPGGRATATGGGIREAACGDGLA
jgi:hypothetical protein